MIADTIHASHTARREGRVLPMAHRIVSGSDDRLDRDPVTGRNEYGTPPLPVAGEIRFSSSTATAVGPRGWQALQDIEATLGQGGRWNRAGLSALCGSIRSRLQARMGIDGSATILCPSGTDAELLMLGTVERATGGPITNIVMAPQESGSGVMAACEGRHFRAHTCLGMAVEEGTRLSGWEAADIRTDAVDIRTPEGTVRSRDDLDTEITGLARAALAEGRTVLLHVLDTSRTGLQVSTRGTAERLMQAAPERVHVVVDACQLRCDAAQMRDDLTRGFAVIVSGSKFAGGPPFSGALFLPPALAVAMQSGPPLTEGLRDYSAAHDWPKALRETLCDGMVPHNDGAALRWVAALAELDALDRIDPALAETITDRFEAEIRSRTEPVPFATPLFHMGDDTPRARSIVPLVARRPDGSPLSLAQAADLHRALRTPLGSAPDAILRRIVNIGQPVVVGERTVLRICIDAPRIVDIASRIGGDRSLDSAFAETLADLDDLFAKWTALVEGKM